jgi:hypothetical protein
MQNNEPPPTFRTYTAQFVRISDVNKQGIVSGIDFKNQFGYKKKETPKKDDTLYHVKDDIDDKDVAKPTKSKKSSSKKPTTKTTNPKKTGTTKRKKGSTRGQKVKAEDEVRWITLKGRRKLLWNGKKIGGRRAYRIYQEYKDLQTKETNKKEVDEDYDDDDGKKDDINDFIEEDILQQFEDDYEEELSDPESVTEPRITRNSINRTHSNVKDSKEQNPKKRTLNLRKSEDRNPKRLKTNDEIVADVIID